MKPQNAINHSRIIRIKYLFATFFHVPIQLVAFHGFANVVCRRIANFALHVLLGLADAEIQIAEPKHVIKPRVRTNVTYAVSSHLLLCCAD